MREVTERAVAFARWCKLLEIEPLKGGVIVDRAYKAWKAAIVNCNEPGHEEILDLRRREFDDYVEEHGFKADWAGKMWPGLIRARDGKSITIPALD